MSRLTAMIIVFSVITLLDMAFKSRSNREAIVLKNLRYDEDSETPVDESYDPNLDTEVKYSYSFGTRNSKSPEVRSPIKAPDFSCTKMKTKRSETQKEGQLTYV